MARALRRRAVRLGSFLVWRDQAAECRTQERSLIWGQLKALAWVLILTSLAIPLSAQPSDSFIPDVVYGHKDGMALTLDVMKPSGEANGAGVLFVISANWVSRWRSPEESPLRGAWEPLLDAGFTVFRVRHGSSPRFTVPDMFSDVRRAVRFVRVRGGDYGVNPNHLGVVGISAGGHLSLLVGLTGDDGDPSSPDEVLRASSRVGAVVAFSVATNLRTREAPSTEFPPTFPGEALSFATGVQPQTRERFPAIDVEDSLLESVSPILHASSDDPPVLLIHGDADTLVDVNNSRSMHSLLRDKGVVTDLIVIEGAGHSFDETERVRARAAMLDWFVTHLLAGN